MSQHIKTWQERQQEAVAAGEFAGFPDAYKDAEIADYRAAAIAAAPPQPATQPYAWVNAGTEQQQTEYATLHVGHENPWVETANAFPVFRHAAAELVAASEAGNTASVQQDRRDAERYRYLRNPDPQPVRELDVCNDDHEIIEGKALDAAIDAALAARKEPKP